MCRTQPKGHTQKGVRMSYLPRSTRRYMGRARPSPSGQLHHNLLNNGIRWTALSPYITVAGIPGQPYYPPVPPSATCAQMACASEARHGYATRLPIRAPPVQAVQAGGHHNLLFRSMGCTELPAHCAVNSPAAAPEPKRSLLACLV